MELHDKQREIVKSPARFKVIRAGRRGGKTTLEVEDMSFDAVSQQDRPIFYIAPTQKQARAIIWEALKRKFAGVGEANEGRLEMKVPTVDGGYSLIYVAGWENRENFRGMKAYKIVFDEVDTMKDFFIGWQEIFRPALTDFRGHATFIGTPKKESGNLRRLEKMAEIDEEWENFHFTSYDNPHIPREEIDKARAEIDAETFKQEYLAEYVDFTTALFRFDALVDVFTNTVDKENAKYLLVDIAEDGSDKTIFSFWEGLEEYRREAYSRLNTEGIIEKIREYCASDRIPFSHVAVDAIGIGAGVASSSLLDGIIGFKSSYSAIKTDISPVHLPNVNYTKEAPLTTDYRNLRSQCVFTLAEHVNSHKIASRVEGQFKEAVIEELTLYQDASVGDGRRFATPKEDIKEALGRSPDHSDTWIMRMYFVIRNRMLPTQSEERIQVLEKQKVHAMQVRNNLHMNSSR